MLIDFVKLSPTQNMTLLITSPVPRKDQFECATVLMDYDGVYAEQTGFVEKASDPKAVARLQMSGGEFCGNATMALAAWIAKKENYQSDVASSLLLEVSGSDSLVECFVKPQKDGAFIGKVKIPLPQGACSQKISFDNTHLSAQIVNMNGITHIIVEDSLKKDKEEALIDHIVEHYRDYTNEDALGVLFLDKQNMEMRPFVYVPSIKSKVWERGCGTGSAAVAYASALQEKHSVTLPVKQPGGIITASSVYTEGEVREIWIEGRVRIVAEGKAYCP